MKVDRGVCLASQGKSVWLILHTFRSEDSGHFCLLGSPRHWDPVDPSQSRTYTVFLFPRSPGEVCQSGFSSIEIVQPLGGANPSKPLV